VITLAEDFLQKQANALATCLTLTLEERIVRSNAGIGAVVVIRVFVVSLSLSLSGKR
jgi:hypothetical protein